jgi:hypothetical protein
MRLLRKRAVPTRHTRIEGYEPSFSLTLQVTVNA